MHNITKHIRQQAEFVNDEPPEKAELPPPSLPSDLVEIKKAIEINEINVDLRTLKISIMALICLQILYNIKEKEQNYQRKIQISSIKSVSKCVVPGKTDWIVHVSKEYDYQFDSENRDEIIGALKYAFHQMFHINLPIYHIPEEVTKAHATQKSD